MKNGAGKEPENPIPSTYQITVIGALSENWREWFNGMLINIQREPEFSSLTTITCNIRDQSELIGILNWLHNLNITIRNVERIDYK